MKLLLKSTITNQKNAERKQEIDEGLALARRIDALRETSAKEEQNLLTYRATALKVVQNEIDILVKQKNDLESEIKRQEEHRRDLLKPLDKEWAELNDKMVKVEKERNSGIMLMLQLKEEEQQLEDRKKEISRIIENVSKKEKEIDKLKGETVSLKELAQREYEMAHDEHSIQTEISEKRMLEVEQLKKEYEVALSIINIREREVKEKEVDIINREQTLERRMRNFQTASRIKTND